MGAHILAITFHHYYPENDKVQIVTQLLFGNYHTRAPLSQGLTRHSTRILRVRPTRVWLDHGLPHFSEQLLFARHGLHIVVKRLALFPLPF